MTNANFQKKLEGIYKSHDILGPIKRKTLNMLLYMLRMDNSVTDYNINVINEKGKEVTCIPSVKQSFVPVDYLKSYVKEVECEEEDYGFDGLCLNVYVED